MNDRGNLYNFSDALQMLAFRRMEDKKPNFDRKRLTALKVAFNISPAQWMLFNKMWKAAQKKCKGEDPYGWRVISETHSLIGNLFFN